MSLSKTALWVMLACAAAGESRLILTTLRLDRQIKSAMPTRPFDLMMIRPAARSRDFIVALQAEAQVSDSRILYTPLIEIVFLDSEIPNPLSAQFIFTSVSGVDAFARLHQARGQPAFCVGGRCAARSAEIGLTVRYQAETVAELIEHLANLAGDNKEFIYPRGEQISCDLTKVLKQHDLAVQEFITYRQSPRVLSADEKNLLKNRALCIPVFSAFGAQCLLKILPELGAEQTHIIAISAEVAKLFDKAAIKVDTASAPSREAMIARIAKIMNEPTSTKN